MQYNLNTLQSCHYSKIRNSAHGQLIFPKMKLNLGANSNEKVGNKWKQFLYLNKDCGEHSEMINNNPYNLPDRPPQKQNRVYTETNGCHFRNESIENIPQHGQPQNRSTLPPSMLMKRSTLNMEEIPGSLRPPYYPAVRTDMKHCLPSPKAQNTSSTGSLNTFGVSRSLIAPQPKKESKEMRESFGMTLDFKEIHDKIEALSAAIKNNQRRIAQLQRNSGGSSLLPNNSKLSEISDQEQRNGVYQELVSKYEQQWAEGMRKLKQDISNVRDQVKVCIKSSDAEQIIKGKIQQIKHACRAEDHQLENAQCRNEEMARLRKQVQGVWAQLEDKINRNHDFITTAVSRVQKEGIISPPYKSTGIKCTGTAILLRFVECFKVRKNNVYTPTKSGAGEVKITVSDTTYYIDCEGFLLDKDQHYLVDSRGLQVRLEDRHIRMLKEENVFA